MKYIILILLFIGSFLTGYLIKHNNISKDIIVSKIDTQVVYRTDTLFVQKLQLKYVKGKIDSFYLPTIEDTAEVVDSFYTPKYYSNKYQFDSSFIIINDTVNHNGIIGRSIDAKIAERIITDTITIEKPQIIKRKWNAVKGFVAGLITFIALNKIIK